MKQKGFLPVEGQSWGYFHPDLRLFLMIYVDDFKLLGPLVT